MDNKLNVLNNLIGNIKLINHIIDLKPEIKGLTDKDSINIHSLNKALSSVYEVNLYSLDLLDQLLDEVLEEPESVSVSVAGCKKLDIKNIIEFLEKEL